MVQKLSWYLGRNVAWSLPRIMPLSDTILFGSDRVDDPDALVILDYLAEHSTRPLRWTARSRPASQLLNLITQRAVACEPEKSVSSVLAYSRSPLIFHTSGLYTSPEPARQRTTITVWHGDGPKSTQLPQIRGTYKVTGVPHFARKWIKVHGYPDANLLVTGRPRVDDLFRGATEQRERPDESQRQLSRLGLDERPIVWWLPTWRQKHSGRRVASSELGKFALQIDSDLLAKYQFVIKPHPLATHTQYPQGWQLLNDSDLYKNEIRLYRILGQAHAIITDYSSVWTDFLNTEIPVGFMIEDIDEFTKARGFLDAGWRKVLPGPIIKSKQDFRLLVEMGWTAEAAKRRRDVVDQLGATNAFGATARLFEALDSKGVEWK